MKYPKITIAKKLEVGKGYYRYFSPLTTDKKDKKKMPTFDLDFFSDSKYPKVKLKTEKDLCWFLHKQWGKGIYMIRAHLKGRKGIYIFWQGEVNDNGFIFFKKKITNTKAVERLKDQIANAESEEDKQMLNDDLNFEREINELDNSNVRYGIRPFLKPSGRRGEFIGWNDEELNDFGNEEQNNEIDNWGVDFEKGKINKKFKDKDLESGEIW